jgi:arginine utilization protein RocB
VRSLPVEFSTREHFSDATPLIKRNEEKNKQTKTQIRRAGSQLGYKLGTSLIQVRFFTTFSTISLMFISI